MQNQMMRLSETVLRRTLISDGYRRKVKWVTGATHCFNQLHRVE